MTSTRATGPNGGFHANQPWWPSRDRSRARPRPEGGAANSRVPVRAPGVLRPSGNPPVSDPTAVYAPADPHTHLAGESEIAVRFKTLAERWREDTHLASSVSGIFLHPAYQEIIGLGPAALPLILDDLARTRVDWFWALRAISGENPVPPEERGQIGRMTERWLEWGHRNGYL